MKYRLYKIVKCVGTPLFKLIFRPTIIGKENIPLDGRVIICGNHTSNLDAAFMISVPDRIVHTLAKKELFNSKIGNAFFRSMGCISVNRSIHDENAKSEAINVLNNEGAIALFPEGTVNKSDKIILPFKYGAVSFASKTHSPIVPFVITGKYKLFRKSITIEYGKAYYVGDDLEKENEKLQNTIINMLKRKEKDGK